jgi:chromosome segregation ATPase
MAESRLSVTSFVAQTLARLSFPVHLFGSGSTDPISQAQSFQLIRDLNASIEMLRASGPDRHFSVGKLQKYEAKIRLLTAELAQHCRTSPAAVDRRVDQQAQRFLNDMSRLEEEKAKVRILLEILDSLDLDYQEFNSQFVDLLTGLDTEVEAAVRTEDYSLIKVDYDQLVAQARPQSRQAVQELITSLRRLYNQLYEVRVVKIRETHETSVIISSLTELITYSQSNALYHASCSTSSEAADKLMKIMTRSVRLNHEAEATWDFIKQAIDVLYQLEEIKRMMPISSAQADSPNELKRKLFELIMPMFQAYTKLDQLFSKNFPEYQSRSLNMEDLGHSDKKAFNACFNFLVKLSDNYKGMASEVKSHINQASSSYSLIVLEREKLTKTVEHQKERIIEVQANADSRRASNDFLEKELQSLKDSLNEQATHVESLNSEVQKLREESVKDKEKLASNKAKLQQAKLLKTELTNAKSSHEFVTGQMMILQQQLAESQGELQALKNSTDAEIAASLREQLKSAKSSAEELKQLNIQLTAQLAKQQPSIEHSFQQLEEARQIENKLQSEINQLRAELDCARKANQTLTKSNEELSQQARHSAEESAKVQSAISTGIQLDDAIEEIQETTNTTTTHKPADQKSAEGHSAATSEAQGDYESMEEVVEITTSSLKYRPGVKTTHKVEEQKTAEAHKDSVAEQEFTEMMANVTKVVGLTTSNRTETTVVIEKHLTLIEELAKLAGKEDYKDDVKSLFRGYSEGLSQWLNVSENSSLNAQAELQEPRVEEALSQLKERIDSLCELSGISVHDETSVLASCLIRLEKLLDGTKASYVLQQDDVNEVNKMLSRHKTNLEAIEIGAQEGDVFLVNQGFFCRRFTAIAFDLLCTLEPSRKAKPTQSKHSKGGAVGKSLQVNKDKEIENLKEQILAKENQVHQLIEEKQAASDNFDAVKEELSKAKQKLTENDEEMNKLTAEHRDCSITIAAIKQVEAQIQQRLTEKEAEIGRLTSDHSQTGSTTDQVALMQANIERLSGTLTEKDLEISRLADAHGSTSDKVALMQAEIEKLTGTLAEKDLEISRLTTDHSQTRSTTDQVASMQAEIEKLTGTLVEKDAEISRLAEAQSQAGSSTDQVSQLNSEIVTLQKSLASKEAHLTSLNRQCAAAQTSSKEIETQLNELKNQLADKNEEIEVLTTQHASCSAALEPFEAQIRELNKKLAAKEEQITKLTAELAASAAKNKAELRSLRWEVTDKTEQIAKLTAAAAQSSSRAPSKTKSAEFESQIANLGKQIAKKDEQLNKLTAEHETCSAKQASLGEQYEAKLRELNEKLSENEKSEKSLNADLKKCFTDFKQMLELFVDNISDYDSREQLKSDISQLSLDNSSEFSDLMNYSAKLPELYYTLLEALSQTRPAHTADEQAKLDQEVFSKLSAELVSLKEKLKAYDSQRTHTDSFVDMSPRTPSRSMNLDTSTYSEASDMLIRTLESDIAAYEQKVRALEVKDRESSDIIHSQKLDIESLQHKVATYQAEMHNRTVKVNMGSDPESKKRYFFNWLELKDNEYRSDKQAQFFMRLKHSRLNSSLNESPPPRATEESKQGTNSSFSTQIHETVGPQGEPQQSQE